jgi:hypothetical protein
MKVFEDSISIPRTKIMGNSNLPKTQRIFARVMQNLFSKVTLIKNEHEILRITDTENEST